MLSKITLAVAWFERIMGQDELIEFEDKRTYEIELFLSLRNINLKHGSVLILRNFEELFF